ncbi:MAG: hypothetical protein E7511_05395 [Ruminococcus sp.]|nr:hypothetical protein [Ruminococcus sp.]
MKQKYRYGTVVLVILVYAVAMVTTICTSNWHVFPVPTVQTMINGVWASQFEQFLAENVGFHDDLFRLKTKTDMLVGEKMIRNVYVTEDRLLEKIEADQNDGYIQASAESLNAFAEDCGVPVYLLLVPSASEIYENRLPANVVKSDQEAAIRETYAQVIGKVRTLDAYHVLSSLSDEYIYYRTDSRWTSYGAYCVYRSVIQKMGFSAVPYHRYVISHMSTEFRGDLYEKTLYDSVKADVLDDYHYEGGSSITGVTAMYADGRVESRGTQLNDPDALATDDMYQYYLGMPCDKLVIQTNLDNGKKLLIYKDGFGDCFIPFLLPHYSEICVVDLERMGMAYETAANPSDYTHVLFLSSMENWKEMWYTDTAGS